MAAASRELNIAQPSLSSHMSGIEQIIGVPLFTRFSRGVTLTDAGLNLLDHACQILAAVEEAESDLLAFAKKGLLKRPIKLALLPSWGTSLAPAIIAATAQELPDVALRIVELRNVEAIRALDGGDVDLAVVLERHPRTLPDAIVREPLMYVSNRRGVDLIKLSDIAHDSLILPSSANPLRGVVDEAASSIGLTLQPTMEIDGQDTVKSAVEAGVGGSIMTWNSIRSECEAGRLFARSITDPAIFRNSYLGRAKGTDEAIADHFFALLTNVAMKALDRPSFDNRKQMAG